MVLTRLGDFLYRAGWVISGLLLFDVPPTIFAYAGFAAGWTNVADCGQRPTPHGYFPQSASIKSRRCSMRVSLPSNRSNRELSAAISDDMIARHCCSIKPWRCSSAPMRCLMSEMSSFIAAMSAWIARKCSKLFANRYRFDTVVSATSALLTCR
jgi:hypothetical protein